MPCWLLTCVFPQLSCNWCLQIILSLHFQAMVDCAYIMDTDKRKYYSGSSRTTEWRKRRRLRDTPSQSTQNANNIEKSSAEEPVLPVSSCMCKSHLLYMRDCASGEVHAILTRESQKGLRFRIIIFLLSGTYQYVIL